MSRYLVTGGAGFIGSHIVRRLVADGHDVRVLDDLSTGKRENVAEVASKIELLEGTICDADTAMRSVQGVDVILHLAAKASVPRSVERPREYHDTNATGTFNMLIAARDAGVKRFVNSSTSAAYGDTPTLPKHEQMPPSPLSPYAAAKLAGEHYCTCFAQVYGMQTVSLRYFNVFGPRQDPKSDYAAAIPAFVTRMVAGARPIVYGTGEQSRDFCYIDNVVDANLRAAAADGVRGEALNIACGERVTINAIIAKINEALSTDTKPDYRDPRPGDVMHSLADLAAAKRLIGYAPRVFFAEGLQRSIGWYRENASNRSAT